MSASVEIAGAGPSGLAAGIAVAENGGRARVLERRSGVGMRFHGDFQGLENWSTERDVLEELHEMGIEPTFEHTPFRECVFYDPDGREHLCRSTQPIWYLVRRGTEEGSLDRSLERQAVAAGVTIEHEHLVQHLPEGGIVAHGPRRVDAIAVGYVFETDRADGAFAAVSDEIAPGGYAYLLICGGRATVATCMFDDFHNDKLYLERTVDLFRSRVGITLRNERRFGGFGNMSAEPHLRRDALLFAGEAAGLQDALFGFGMRYAMVSGHLAGKAYASGDLDRYEADCRERLLGFVRSASVNRYLYRRGGDRRYRYLVRGLCRGDARTWLRRHYVGGWWSPLLYPL
ncbi:MAG: hypothetical protein WEA34_11575, partial [Gemmatimonadota bacterium]